MSFLYNYLPVLYSLPQIFDIQQFYHISDQYVVLFYYDPL